MSAPQAATGGKDANAKPAKPAKKPTAKELKKAQKQAARAARKEKAAAGGGPVPSTAAGNGGNGGNGGSNNNNNANNVGGGASNGGSGSAGSSSAGSGAGGSGQGAASANGANANANAPNTGNLNVSGNAQVIAGGAGFAPGINNDQTASQDLHLFTGIELPKAIVSKRTVHPAILHLALQMRSCRIIGSTQRCRAMMLAFQQVISDYEVPEKSTLSRSLAVHFSHQIEVLKSGRGLSVAMGNAIRWLKQETSELRIDVSDYDAKQYLIEAISVFIRDRLDVADKIIVADAASHVRSGDVILTYAKSQVVVDTLVHAFVEQQKKFRVIVADAPPLFEGRQAAARLVEVGIPTTYIAASALPYVMKGVTTLMVGAHAIVSNGNLFSRAGTAMVAVLAAARGIPLLVLCETIKFSDRVQLDAFSVNELIPSSESSNSVFFDLTDQSLISKVITEVGALPASSVPVILKEYKQVL